jgi:RND superfamily putative drug exporter
LERLGEAVLRHRYATVAVWAALAVAGAVLGSGLYDRLSNGGYAVPGSDSQQAVRIVARDFQFGGETRLFALLEYPRGALAARRPGSRAAPSPAAHLAFERAGLAASRTLLAQPDVAHVDGPSTSTDGRVSILQFFMRHSEAEAQRRVPTIRATLRRALAPDAHVEVVGRVAVFQRYSAVARADLARAEAISLPVILAMLLVAFLSVIAAGIPLLLAGTALAVTYGALHLLSLGLTLSVFVTNTASILALGLSIDFSLFVVTRFREELAAGRSPDDAVRTIMRTTARAIMLSGATVATSLMTLTLVGVKAFSSMAIGASLATLISTAVAVTLLPAVLSLLGGNVDRLSLRRIAEPASSARLWTRLGDAIVARPKTWLAAGLTVMILLTLPIGAMHVDVRTLDNLPAYDPLRQTYDRVARSFEPGAFSPVELLTHGSSSAVDGIAYNTPGVSSIPNRSESTRTGWSYVRVVPHSFPDSPAAERTVKHLRHATAGLPARTLVGGQTAEAIDLRSRIATRAPWVILTTCLFGAAVLMYGLRSIVIPIKAMLSTLLSTTATLGLLILLSPGDGSTGALAFFVPLFLFATVFGLSVDYEVFLLSRVREAHLNGHGNADAVRIGLAKSGRSITVAGMILATVFLSLATSPLVPFKQLGLGLGIAVLLDVTLVRCVMVPATLVLFGRWNWWFPGGGDGRRRPGR